MSQVEFTGDNHKSITQSWLKTIVIDYGLCPFAKHELERGAIYFTVANDTDLEGCLLKLMQECDRLDTNPDIETTLLIFPDNFKVFDDYLDFLGLAEALLIEQDYEGIYQLASFHPDYCFAGSKQDDPSNYTNRSPYPMLHLLRESSIEQAVTHYPDAENIPQRNIDLTRKLGLAKMQALLAACYKMDE